MPEYPKRVTKQIIGMNSYDDSTTLPEGVVKLIQNMLPKKTSLETRTGWAKYNSVVLPASSGVFGIKRYAPSTTLNLELAVSAGKLYSGNAGTFTERYTALSSTNLCQIVQSSDKALVVDQTNKLLVYKYGETPYLAGINSPKEYKLIEDFEAASGWTVTNGTATNNTLSGIYGTQCITFLTSAGAVMRASKAISAKNLTIFDDTSTSSTSDYISIFVIRGVPTDFSYCALDLGNSTFTSYYRAYLSNVQEWIADTTPGSALEIKVRKSSFTDVVGSPNWNNITAIRIDVTATTGKQAQIICDFCRLEKTGPIPTLIAEPEKVVNGTFTTTSDPWTYDAANWTYSGSANMDKNVNGIGVLQQNVNVIAGVTYSLTYTISGTGTIGEIRPHLGGTFGALRGGEFLAANGTWTETIKAINTGNLIFTVSNDARLTIDDVSVKRSILNGVYWYRVTFVDKDGSESDTSVISDPVTISVAAVTISNIPIPGSSRIASKRIYRIGGTSSEWRLVASLYDVKITSYQDNVADGNLGEILAEVEGQPYIPKCITIHDKMVVIANLTSPDATPYPCGVMVSEEESVDVYDHNNFFEIEPNMGEIRWVLSAKDFVYVGKTDSIWKFDPLNLTNPPINLSRLSSGVGPLAVTEGDNEIFFLDGAKGVMSFNGSFFEDIGVASPNRLSSIQNYLDLIPDAYIHTCWMRYHNGFLLVGVPQTGDTSPTLILAYYTPKQIWVVISGWAVRCGYSAKVDGANILHLGHSTTGYVYNCFTGDDDNGTPITSIIQFSDWDFGAPEMRKDYKKIFFFGKKLTTTDATLTIEPYLDTVDTTIDLSLTLDSTTNKRLEVPMPQLTYYGTYLGLRVTAIKRWAFRALIEFARTVGGI